MKFKWRTLLAGVMVLALTLLAEDRTAAAAPKEEVKTAAQYLGYEIPLPRMEGVSANDWIQLLYDHLIGSTSDMKLSPEMSLAKKWEMSPDGITWTFYLRTGVKFHDGVELTAKDVKFSLEQIMLPDSKANNSGVFRQAIKSIEVKDPYTLVIQCKRPFLFLAHFLSDIEGMDTVVIPKDHFERVGQEQFIKHPIGSGPYKWHSQLVGSYIKLESTGKKHWRDGVPKYKYMTYLLIPEESSRIAMLRTGEADIAMVSRESMKEVLGAGLKIIPERGAGVLCFYPDMQWTSPVFSDIRFRKALNLAIDKEAIIKHLLLGQGVPIATLPGNAMVTCGGDPTLKPYPYNPEEARRLIKEGGYEGYEFDVPVFDRVEFPELPRAAEAVVGYWQKVGLKPKIFLTRYDAWRERWQAQKTQNTIMVIDTLVVPGCGAILRNLQQKLHSKSKQTHVTLPYLDERFEKIFSSVDPPQVEKLMGEIYRYTYDQYLVAPICDFNGMLAVTKQIPTWDLGRRRRDKNYRALIRQQ